jgi:hypothetical protein
MSRRLPPPPSDKAREGLANYRAKISEDKRRAIERAIKHLRKIDAPINVSTVAARAGVQRKTVYKHGDLVAVIDQYRRQPAAADTGSGGRETSIVAALRAQIAAKDNEIRKLRTRVREHESTIALLYGRLDSQS